MIEVRSSSAEEQVQFKNKMNELLTVKQFCAAFPWPTESAMRSYIYRADELGIADAFLRVNRRVLVIPQNFFTLIREVESKMKGVCDEKSIWQKGRANTKTCE